jgi:hypothetical protein
MNREELIVMYAFMLATRSNTDYKSNIDVAFKAVDYLLEKLEEEKNNE